MKEKPLCLMRSNKFKIFYEKYKKQYVKQEMNNKKGNKFHYYLKLIAGNGFYNK